MWLKLIPAAQSGYPFPIVPTPAMEEGASPPVGSCHPMPLSTVFLAQWCLDGLKNGVPASALECLIRTETAPMTAKEKWRVPMRLHALQQAVAVFIPE